MPASPPCAVFILASSLAPRRLLSGQCRRLKQADLDVVVVASPGPDLEAFSAIEGVRTVAIPIERQPAPLRDIVALARLWRLLRRLRPKIVEAGTPKAGLLGMLAAWLADVPLRIYKLHGLRLETASGLRLGVLRSLEKLAAAAATHVLCVGHELRECAVGLGLFPAGKATVLAAGSANGVDLERFRPSPRPRNAPPTIGFVGRFTRDKGIEELIEAFERVRERIPSVRLLALGAHEDGDPLPAALRLKLANDPAIELPGFVDDPAPYYSRMDVVALPSRREGLPLVLLEAAASARPIVATRATGVAEAVEHGVSGLLVEHGDIDALAGALAELLLDPAQADELGLAGRARMERLFSSREVAEHKADLFQRLVDEESAGGGPVSRVIRRSVDLAAASVGLVLALPLMALCAVAVRISIRASPLFRQERVGLHGRPFTLWKLRTMTDERDASGRLLVDRHRLTPLGKLLRRSSIDELPQLWNVLRGEMSLVGPRPLVEETLRRFPEYRRRRQSVKPGLTGWAQVQGRNRLGWVEKIELDVSYAAERTLRLDLRILLRTVPLLLGSSAETPAPALPNPPSLDPMPGRRDAGAA